MKLEERKRNHRSMLRDSDAQPGDCVVLPMDEGMVFEVGREGLRRPSCTGLGISPQCTDCSGLQMLQRLALAITHPQGSRG